MKILVLATEGTPQPRTGWAHLLYHIVPYLARHHEVRVCFARGTAPDLGDRVRVDIVSPGSDPRGPWGRRADSMRGLILGLPIAVAHARSVPMVDWAARALRESPPDLVVTFEFAAVSYCPSEWRARLVALIEDPPSLRTLRVARLRLFRGLQWGHHAFDVLPAWVYERRVLRAAARVLVLSTEDAQVMRTWSRLPNLSTVPYGVDVPPRAAIRPRAERHEGEMIITGNMGHAPNADGVVWFLDEVLPRVLARRPRAKLRLVGAGSTPALQRRVEGLREVVEMVGPVAEVPSYIGQAQVAICPVRLRIGMQTKILEALAWGTPVVTTSAGNSGVCGQDGVHLDVASTPDQMAQRVLALLDGHGWEARVDAGYALARDSFSWGASGRAMEAHLNEVIAELAHGRSVLRPAGSNVGS